jgi:hypothetical protein
MRRIRFALLAVAVAALAVGGTALAAKSHGQSPRTTGVAGFLHGPLHGPGRGGPSDELAAAASYLGATTDALLGQLRGGKTLAEVADATSGKSTSGLIAALVAYEKQELVAAVSAGKLTQAQSDQLASTLTRRFTDLVNGVHPAMPPAGGPHGHGDGLQAITAYLGISADAVATQLRAGKTLAQIANVTPGKSASGLIDALVADVAKRFGANAPSDLRQHITDLVNGVRPAFGPGGGRPHDHWGETPHGRRA